MTRTRNDEQAGAATPSTVERPTPSTVERLVIGYLRVSTSEQGRSGLGLESQREAIEQAADVRGWEVIEWITDTSSGKSLKRPGIQRALELMEDGGPDVLVAAKLDRISRSAIDFLGLVKRAEDHGWQLVLLDPNVDMTDPMGRFTASILASVAQLEREMIGQRTRDALAAAREKGTKLGRPDARPLSPSTVARIRDEHQRGASLRGIADELNRDGIQTSTGKGQWYASTVKAVLDRD